ncbi:MAG: stage II sporulation protein D [Oscillospiraceae bacterium]|nr:stage II sporulation protein D [Oscillospiraceae bacterium]
MKKKVLFYLFLCILLTSIPLLPVKLFGQKLSTKEPEQLAETETVPTPSGRECYHVLDKDTGEISEIPVRDYLIGAVGAEMPVSFELEALKAQAVAAHTYAERQARLADKRPDLKGADFSNDASQYQAFYTKEELEKLYNDNFQEYYHKLETVADSVLNEMIYYENEPIIAAFHAMSGGKTESAQNVWGSDIAYLQSVDSKADKNAPQFEQTVTYSAEEVKTMLLSSREGLFLGTDTAHWFGEPEYSEAGTVLQIPVGTSIFTGQELRTVFSLRSAVFSIQYENQNFQFITHGYGHDVGMSQYGANEMAKSGADYKEILAYYYPNTEIKNSD